MKIVKKIGILAIFIILILTIFNITSVNAASTTLTATDATVKSGETFSITVKSSINLTGWTVTLTDDGGCTFSSVSGGEVTGTTVYGADSSGKTSLATYKFKAPTVTKDTKYTISFSGTEMCDVNTDEVDNTTCKATITVKATETTNNNTGSNNSSNGSTSSTTKSSDATLSTLGVRPAEYDFNNFSKNKTSYSVTVPNDVDKLDVIAVASAGSKAKISISGNTNLKVGSSNNISVVVTAEDGTKKTYTIKVTKLAQEDEKEGNLIEENEENNEENKDTVENELKLESLTVKNFTLNPEFSSDTYSYTIDINMNENDVDKLELEYSANSDNANIEVIGNENLKEGENIITIMLSSEDSENTVIYQIVVNKINSSSEIANLDVNDNNTINKIKTIVISVFVGMIILIIGLIILIHFREKKLNEEFNYNDNKGKEPTKNTENKMFYENEKDDKEILNKINKNKGKHF